MKNLRKKAFHCCQHMIDRLADERVPLKFCPNFSEYSIKTKDMTQAVGMFFCPWCGSRFKERSRGNIIPLLKEDWTVIDRWCVGIRKKIPQIPQHIFEDPNFLNQDAVKNRDILRELYFGKITEKASVEIFETLYVMDKIDKLEQIDDEYNSPGYLSFAEEQAYIREDVPLSIVAQWRYNGWHSKCVKCGNELNVNVDSWSTTADFVAEDLINGKNVLLHFDCYQAYCEIKK